MSETAEAPVLKKISEEEYNRLVTESLKEKPKAAAPAPAPVVPPVDKSKDIVEPLAKKDEKPAEAKVEKVEPKEEAAPQPKQKLRDKIKGKFLTEEKPAATQTPTLSIEELQKQLNELKAEREAERNDPSVKLAKAATAKGKNLFQYLKENQTPDLSLMTRAQIYEYGLKKAGVKPTDELDPNSDETSLEEEMQKFKDMPRLSQDDMINKIKSDVDKETEAHQNELLSKLTAVDPEAKAREERTLADAREVHGTIQSAIGQEIFGMTFTEDMANKVLQKIAKNELIPKRDDGSIDSRKFFQGLILAEYSDMIFDNLEKTYFAEGVHQIADEVEATPTSETQNTRPPEIQNKLIKGTEEWAAKASQSLVPAK